MRSNGPGSLLRGLIILCTIITSSALMAGCSTVSALSGRAHLADETAGKAGFKKEYITAGDFTLLTYQKITKPGKSIRIYIEGDGNAWETKRRLSDDPTPRQPVALYLAGKDPSANVVYIARPGQFPQDGFVSCDPAYWSSRRFSSEVIDVFNKAIDKVKTGAEAPDVELIGYSGGSAIAVIVAAKRNDVMSLRTVAGNLDHEAVNRYHKVDPIKGSLNPIDFAAKVSHIPQRHFVAADDSVVPISTAESFAEKIGDKKHESITIVEGAGHTTGWRKAWPLFANVPLYRQK